jgi:hypothetical protein
LVGRLQHASRAIPMANYFLQRFYRLIAEYNNPFVRRSLERGDKSLLRLWIGFLQQAAQGVSLNLLTIRRPTTVVISDACPTGMGGYSIRSGKAWRFQFPTPLTNMNNTAEFLASVVTILFMLNIGDIEEEGVVLALTDNCSCAAWLHQNNVDEQRNPLRAVIAMKIATTCMNRNFVIHPQHVPGKENAAADDLSRRFDLTDNQLTQAIRSTCYLQAPKNFKIYPVPEDISLWIYSSAVLKQLYNTPLEKDMQTSKTERGAGGEPSQNKQDWQRTYSWTASTHAKNGPSPNASSMPYGLGTMEKADIGMPLSKMVRDRFLGELYKKPLASWLRLSGTTTGHHHSMTKELQTGWLHASMPQSKGTTVLTQGPSERKQSP